MTPKENAEHLIEKYYQTLFSVLDVNNAYNLSRQCAAVCANEILNIVPPIMSTDDTEVCFEHEEYWKEVLNYLNA